MNGDDKAKSVATLIGLFADIVELAECGLRRANEYLEHGYRLLSMNATTYQKQGPNGWYIRRGFTYVLGRTAEVAHHDPLPFEDGSGRKEEPPMEKGPSGGEDG